MAKLTRGARSVSERIVKDSRALIVTSENYEDYDFSALPDGTLHVDTKTGVISAKLEGQATWQPTTLTFDKAELDADGKIVNVQNPTLVIARDTQVIEEKYIVGEIDPAGKSFFYYIDSMDNDHKRQSLITESDGYIFGLEEGENFGGRNHITVTVNNSDIYTVKSGEVKELSNKRIGLKLGLETGDKVCVRYYRWARIGSPCPRIYLTDKIPDMPDEGDFWLDKNTELGGKTMPAFKYFENGKWETVYGDYLEVIGDMIDLEAAARAEADKDILDKLNKEIRDRAAGDKALEDKINALNATVRSADNAAGKGTFVNIEVTETKGKLTSAKVTENDIASAAALSKETTDRQNADKALSDRIGKGLGSETQPVYVDSNGNIKPVKYDFGSFIKRIELGEGVLSWTDQDDETGIYFFNTTVKTWENPGSYTWTCPPGVKAVDCVVIGGGSGAFTCTPNEADYGRSSGDGGDSGIGSLVTATGGKGYTFDASWSSVPDGEYANAGSPDGNNGHRQYGDHASNDTHAGLGFEKGWGRKVIEITSTVGARESTRSANGVGGGGFSYMGNPDGHNISITGGSGGIVIKKLTVVPKTTYTITVGAGGKGLAIDHSDSDGQYAQDGEAGLVMLRYPSEF